MELIMLLGAIFLCIVNFGLPKIEKAIVNRRNRALGSSLKNEKTIVAEPEPQVPELRSTLETIKVHDQHNPFKQQVYQSSRYSNGYYVWKVIDGKETEADEWSKEFQNRHDTLIREYIRGVFVRVDDTAIKMQIQILWDETVVKISEIRIKTGESGDAVYREQMAGIRECVEALEKRYEANVFAEQRLYTNFINDLRRDLVEKPAIEARVENLVLDTPLPSGGTIPFLLMKEPSDHEKGLAHLYGMEYYHSVNIDGAWWELRDIQKEVMSIADEIEAIRRSIDAKYPLIHNPDVY